MGRELEKGLDYVCISNNAYPFSVVAGLFPDEGEVMVEAVVVEAVVVERPTYSETQVIYNQSRFERSDLLEWMASLDRQHEQVKWNEIQISPQETGLEG